MIKAIIRRESKKNGGKLIMVFPEITRNYRLESFCSVSAIADYGYCHNEISLDYYHTTKPVFYDMPEVLSFVARYEKYIRTLPDCNDEYIKLVKKLIK